MKLAVVFLFLPILSLAAGELWPPVGFADVRAFSWPTKFGHKAVILPGMRLAPGVINEAGTPLSPEQVARLRAALTGEHPNHSRGFCYEPHNAFMFYSAAKEPVAFVEICFACLHYRSEPKGVAETYDVVALAAIFDELKLPLGMYANLKEFREHFVRFSK